MTTSVENHGDVVLASEGGLSYNAFLKLLRSTPTTLDAYIGRVGDSTGVDNTMVSVHCQFLKSDGMGVPRVPALANRLAQGLVDYAIPRSDIAKAKADDTGAHDTRHVVALYRRANRLFTDLAKTGEGGELLLFLLAETFLQLPQLFCKMPLKTSSKMHFHGADGIHGSYDDSSGTLALYWGESKLHKTPSAAIADCFKSIAPFLLPDGSSAAPQERDLQLLSDNVDLGDPKLQQAILSYLDPDDPLFNQLTYRGLALVGFDSSEYGTLGKTVAEQSLNTALTKASESWHKLIGTHVASNKVSSIEIELFCLPFPSVDDFRKAFLEELGIK